RRPVAPCGRFLFIPNSTFFLIRQGRNGILDQMSIQLSDFDRWVRSILDFRTYAGIDSAINGLQVARKNREISRVAFAVDASMETFRRAVQARADLLFVHHGLFWGAQMPITGGHYD